MGVLFLFQPVISWRKSNTKDIRQCKRKQHFPFWQARLTCHGQQQAASFRGELAYIDLGRVRPTWWLFIPARKYYTARALLGYIAAEGMLLLQAQAPLLSVVGYLFLWKAINVNCCNLVPLEVMKWNNCICRPQFKIFDVDVFSHMLNWYHSEL